MLSETPELTKHQDAPDPNKAFPVVWTLAAIALFINSTILPGSVPGTLFPNGRKLSVNIELSSTTTLNMSQLVANQVGKLLQSKNYLESVVKLVGQRSNLVGESGIKPSTGSYLVGFSAIFTPAEEREKPSYDYLDQHR